MIISSAVSLLYLFLVRMCPPSRFLLGNPSPTLTVRSAPFIDWLSSSQYALGICGLFV